MTPRRALAVIVALVLPLLAAAHAWAGAPSDQLRGSIDRVVKVLGDPELKGDGKLRERRAAVRRIASEIFDFGETTKRSLGRHWQGRTPGERDEFVQLFADLLERSYITKIEEYSGERVAFLGDSIDSDHATVRTKIVTKQGTEIPVDYRMLRRGDRWLAYDVAIEGVSLVANYRTQFHKIIQSSSYPELVKRLRAKQDGAHAEGSAATRRTSQK